MLKNVKKLSLTESILFNFGTVEQAKWHHREKWVTPPIWRREKQLNRGPVLKGTLRTTVKFLISSMTRGQKDCSVCWASLPPAPNASADIL
ncbi:hypothetical protein EYF80_003965 [Liparis tanakae]|uniref:Uncharacterized protein n=1 Tax=Liparis tanakae TaxID=230148 RepID=A0A4Z2J7Q2_9TELE|nr:hypothetical protein EYF80_003965 [Liparis tanakae]